MDHVDLLTTKQAAKFLGRDPQTLWRWRQSGSGPKYSRMGPSWVFYRLSDLEAYRDRVFQSTAEEAAAAAGEPLAKAA